MGKGKSTEERIKYFKDMFPIKFNDEIRRVERAVCLRP